MFTKHHCDDDKNKEKATKGPKYISYGALMADSIPGRIYSKVLPLANNYTDPRELSTTSTDQPLNYRTKFQEKSTLSNLQQEY
ncbi:hypothetical protein ACQ4LE_007085 [Meloidogyne hapla]|uniref:Ovule protein n=1 Tax=Meloidogyne hapla TaxID=6305 RepID=A0A1I8BHB9_MELHA